MEEKLINIPEKLYLKLVKDSEFLEILEAYGVDNWQGYDEAVDAFNEE